MEYGCTLHALTRQIAIFLRPLHSPSMISRSYCSHARGGALFLLVGLLSSMQALVLQGAPEKADGLPLAEGLARLELAAAPERLHYHVGEQVTLNVFVINNSGDQRILFRSNTWISPTVRLNDTIDVRLPPPTDPKKRAEKIWALDGSDFSAHVGPNLALPSKISLNGDFDLSKPGHYTVELRRYFLTDPRPLPDHRHAEIDSKKERNFISTTTEFFVD